jgi:hypothetical protein
VPRRAKLVAAVARGSTWEMLSVGVLLNSGLPHLLMAICSGALSRRLLMSFAGMEATAIQLTWISGSTPSAQRRSSRTHTTASSAHSTAAVKSEADCRLAHDEFMSTEINTETKVLTTLRKAQLAAEAAQVERIREASRLIDLSRSIEKTIKSMETLCREKTS